MNRLLTQQEIEDDIHNALLKVAKDMNLTYEELMVKLADELKDLLQK